MKHVVVGWFEIPVSDMERAMSFYGKVFDCKLERNQMGPFDMAWFPWDHEQKGAGGSLVRHKEDYQPSDKGVLVYFSSVDIDTELSKVKVAGGKVLQEKTLIAKDVGYMALFTDSEGNRIGFHSKK